jgi:hypothetical protein
MHPTIRDIESLLVMSRSLLGEQELTPERLQAWGAEREVIFTRLKSHDLALGSEGSSAAAVLMSELREVDAKICTRVIENQRRLGEQITAAKKMRRALGQSISHPPRLLERLV